jgi:hypothetical protein
MRPNPDDSPAMSSRGARRKQTKGADDQGAAKLETAGSAEEPSLWGGLSMEGTLGAADRISFREEVREAALGRSCESGVVLAGS